MAQTPISIDQVSQQLERLGVVRGGVLVVHTSFRAAGPVEGGPDGVLRALGRALGPSGTLVMPTMTDGVSVFDPRSTPTHKMGIVAERFWREPGVVRSPHPGASFAATGPHAAEICAPHPLSPPHGPDSPVGRALNRGGQVLLLGVGHTENTTLHLAETIAGVPYSVPHACVIADGGEPRTVHIHETDHCCRRFALVDGWLDHGSLQQRGQVGHARSRLSFASDIVDVAVEHMRTDPMVFLCRAEGAPCGECALARVSARLRPAHRDELAELSELCMRSKAHWGYDNTFMQQCRAELTLTVADVQDTAIAVIDDVCRRPVAVAQVSWQGGDACLEKLFVAPDNHGRGLGRLLYTWSLAEAGRRGCGRLIVESDPGAVDFYRAMGAAPAGSAPSQSIPGRELPRLVQRV